MKKSKLSSIYIEQKLEVPRFVATSPPSFSLLLNLELQPTTVADWRPSSSLFLARSKHFQPFALSLSWSPSSSTAVVADSAAFVPFDLHRASKVITTYHPSPHSIAHHPLPHTSIGVDLLGVADDIISGKFKFQG